MRPHQPGTLLVCPGHQLDSVEIAVTQTKEKHKMEDGSHGGEGEE